MCTWNPWYLVFGIRLVSFPVTRTGAPGASLCVKVKVPMGEGPASTCKSALASHVFPEAWTDSTAQKSVLRLHQLRIEPSRLCPTLTLDQQKKNQGCKTNQHHHDAKLCFCVCRRFRRAFCALVQLSLSSIDRREQTLVVDLCTRLGESQCFPSLPHQSY